MHNLKEKQAQNMFHRKIEQNKNK